MKWIGQHIYDLISRFRSDVYLEDISTGTIASGGNLGLDSNNKIVKDDGDGVTDLHSAGVDGDNNQVLTDNGDGTITSEPYFEFRNTGNISSLKLASNEDTLDYFTISTTTSGATTLTTVDSGATAAHFEIVADGDITLDSAGQIKLEPAAGNNILLDGTIAIDAGVVTGATSITSTAFVGTLSTAVQPNITTVGTLDTGNATAIVDTASLTTAGKVELATTAEADTGTDTARAVTPAGLKSHVDARYAYQYIMFFGLDQIKSNWITFGQSGLTNHTWGTDTSDSGVTVGSSTMACTNVMQAAAFQIPFACKLVGFYGTGHRYSGSNTFAGGVFILDSPDYNSAASGGVVDTVNATLRAYADAEQDGSTGFNQKLNKIVDTSRSFDCPAGSMIFPAFKDTAGVDSGSFRGSMTVVLATPIITIA